MHRPLDRNLVVFIREKLYNANKNFFATLLECGITAVNAFDRVLYIEKVKTAKIFYGVV